MRLIFVILLSEDALVFPFELPVLLPQLGVQQAQLSALLQGLADQLLVQLQRVRGRLQLNRA